MCKSIFNRSAFFFVFVCLLVCFVRESSAEGISLSALRVVYPSDRTAVTVTINNSTKQDYLIQSLVRMVDFGTGMPSDNLAPFIVTPPLVRLNGDNKMPVKVIYDGQGLPNDRESVFYIGIKAIPSLSEGKLTDNELNIGLMYFVKLFYRPKKINKANFLSISSSQRFKFNDPKSVMVINPTPYYITFSELAVDDVRVSERELHKMVPPSGSQIYQVSNLSFKNRNKHEITWQIIDDTGRFTPLQRKRVALM